MDHFLFFIPTPITREKSKREIESKVKMKHPKEGLVW
jgi:hypothetical protein